MTYGRDPTDRSFAFSGDGSKLFSATDDGIELWAVQNDLTVIHLHPPDRVPQHLHFMDLQQVAFDLAGCGKRVLEVLSDIAIALCDASIHAKVTE
jgi:hypothetical protein